MVALFFAGCAHDPLTMALTDNETSPYLYALFVRPQLSVVSTSPADGATDVSIGTAVSVIFSSLMNPSTVTVQAAGGPCTADSFQVSADGFATCVGGTISSTDNTTFTVAPASGLSYSTNYQIRITTAVKDVGGAALPAIFTTPTGFTTVSLGAFSVTATAPADGASGVATGTTIAITFNRAASPATITANTTDTTCAGYSFQVSADNFATCVQMTGAPVSSGGDQTFTVTPNAALANDTTYKVRVTTAAEDSFGTPLPADFTTAGGFTTLKIMQPPANVAAYIGYTCLTLSWTNPSDPEFSAVRIQRTTSLPYPATPTDGTNVYDGPAASLSDAALTGGQPYYYTIFAYDIHNNYSVGVSVTATPQGHKWFTNFTEYASNPVLKSATQRRYYPYVVYDANAFGNTIGDDIDGAGSGTDTYTVMPYYKVWVGDGTNTDFLYSDDGINWVEPSVGSNIVTGHYHPTVVYNMGGVSGYRMWNWDINSTLDYYTSSDGITWTLDTSGRITQTLNVEPDLPFSAVYEIASITYEGSTYYAWINSNGHWNMVSSTDAKSWTNLGECTLDISTMTGNQFNTDGRLCVLHRNGIYQMWYSSDENGDFIYTPTDKRRYGISYAESSDGLAFTAVNTLNYKGTAATIPGPESDAILDRYDSIVWRNVIVYSPMVIYDANRFSSHGEAREYKMYYSGDSSDTVTYPRRASGYASFDDISCE